MMINDKAKTDVEGSVRGIFRVFTCRLHSMVLILVRLVTAQFMQRDSSAGIHRSKTFWVDAIAPFLHVHIACIVRTTEKCTDGR